ncbi:hypothetical protein CDL12_11941 [Handroanthus impetiginosus]|uniref:Uncharacterized protein n=1 Tax=Handroanthus impetiginosus TaxID=429701 RepID=A0A2G9HD22_9LAMI|nr:hypothetical protein CDL12_11941 [Handroanthus impetiginosus]
MNKYILVKAYSVLNTSLCSLCSTTVSTVRPGPNPKSTPHSSPSPVELNPSFAELFRISSSINNTHALDIFPYSLKTCLVDLSFSGLRSNFVST